MMKYLNKIIVLIAFTLAFVSCEENENFEILPAQESFQIVTPSSGSVIVLNDENLDNPGLFISWETLSTATAPYTIEVALTGTSFENAYILGTSESKNFSMSVGDLNNFLLDTMELNPEEALSIDVRVIDSMGNATTSIPIVLTPYKVEFTEFYLVGSLTNWNPEEALEMKNIDLNIFEITIDLPADAEFKFLPTFGSWDGDFGEDPDNAGMLISEGEVNVSGYAEGKYKVTVDLNTFTFTVDPILAPEELFLVGSIVGWNQNNALPFNKIDDNRFNIVVDLPEGAEIKFLETLGDWTGDWGEDPENPGSIIQEGEQNVSGLAAGNYLIMVDYSTLTYNAIPVDNLFLVGSLTGWDPGTSIEMGKASLGVFSTVIDLPDAAEFKFLPQNTGWDGDWGEDPENPGSIIQDGEQNVAGFAAGKYVVAVNFNTLSYTVSAVSEIPSSLFLVGSFNGWSNDASSPEFTESSPGVFFIKQTLSADDEFKFVPVAGDWGNDWGENKLSSMVLEQGDEQNVKVTEGDNYHIEVNFLDGTITVQLD